MIDGINANRAKDRSLPHLIPGRLSRESESHL